MTIHERARKYISKINAVSGQEGHKQTFKVASILQCGFALPAEEAMAIMMSWNKANASPPWSEHAIWQKLQSVSCGDSYPFGHLLQPEEKAELGLEIHQVAIRPKRKRWPKCESEKVIDLLRHSFISLEDFHRQSPAKPEGFSNPYTILDHLFCRGEIKDPYLCLGKTVYQAETRKRSEWNGKLETNDWQYIVPNPMLGPLAETATGKLSPRAKTNVLERRFIVIECDFDRDKHPEIFQVVDEMKISVQDVCATVLTELNKTAQLTLAVNSGSKSIHGWFPVLAASRRAQIDFFRIACLLGADSQMVNTHQWTRFPTGVREANGVVQCVEYFNPDPFLVEF